MSGSCVSGLVTGRGPNSASSSFGLVSTNREMSGSVRFGFARSSSKLFVLFRAPVRTRGSATERDKGAVTMLPGTVKS